MRILYLCHRIPYPPDKGDKIRAFHQIRAIAARHEVDLFTLADDPGDLKYEPALREYCGRVVVARLNPYLAKLRSLPYLLTSQPLTIPFFRSAGLQEQVNRALAERAYDRILVYCSAMAQYVESARIPVVTDLVDVDSDKWRQYATFTKPPFSTIYRREGEALRRYERQVCERSACVVVTTGREAELVRAILPSARVHVVPNGVDTEHFQPGREPSSAAAGSVTVGFVGDMSYFPNQEAVLFFARKVLPLIRERVPAVRFLIVGRNPNDAVKRLEQVEGVEVTGFVPDVRTHLARMAVSVAPFSIAAGIQNKILEAMAYEVPVIGTSRAVQGLSAHAAAVVDVADTPETMASKIAELLRNPGMAREKGRESRRCVTAEYHWGRSLDRLLGLLESPQAAISTVL